MGLKSWIASRVTSNILKKMKVDKPHRDKITKTVKNMVNGKRAVQNEPVMLGGFITIAVSLGASYGLDLSVEQLTVTVSTIIAVVSFIQRKLVSPVKKVKKG